MAFGLVGPQSRGLLDLQVSPVFKIPQLSLQELLRFLQSHGPSIPQAFNLPVSPQRGLQIFESSDSFKYQSSSFVTLPSGSAVFQSWSPVHGPSISRAPSSKFGFPAWNLSSSSIFKISPSLWSSSSRPAASWSLSLGPSVFEHL